MVFSGLDGGSIPLTMAYSKAVWDGEPKSLEFGLGVAVCIGSRENPAFYMNMSTH